MTDHGQGETCGRTAIGRGVALVLALLTVGLSLLPATGAAARERAARVVVTFAAETTASARADALDNGTVVDEIPLPRSRRGARAPALAVMTVTPRQRAELTAAPGVVAVEDDVVVRADDAAADGLASDPGFRLADGLRLVGVDLAWNVTIGARGTTIAIIDSGVDAGNPDLAGKMAPGIDLVNDDADPDDDNGHGTAVASVAAAAAGDGNDVAGVCQTCDIMPIKALDASGAGFLSDAARGIQWAVEHDADVINLSLSGTSRLYAMDVALQAARDAGVPVIASAGNAATTTEHWPAAHDLAVAVAAVDGTRRADYSNYGAWIDIAAPGCNPAATLDGGVRRFCGTSSSSPLVAGVAALVLSANPDLDAAGVAGVLTTTATPLGAGLGAGMVEAYDAVTAATSYTAPPDETPEPAQDLPADPYAEPTPDTAPADPTPPAPAPDTAPTPDHGGGTPAVQFDDIAGNVHRDTIRTLAAAGITSGCDATSYCPARTVTRGQMATLLVRALDLPAATGTFDDVPAGHPHAAGIAALAAAGVTNGCGAQAFCPDATVTRAQMASFLVRALGL